MWLFSLGLVAFVQKKYGSDDAADYLQTCSKFGCTTAVVVVTAFFKIVFYSCWIN